MTSGRTTARKTAIILAFLMAAPAATVACDVPVYRYALERWPPDAYQVLVFHRAKLTAEEEQAVDVLRKASSAAGGHANLVVRAVDLSAPLPASVEALWRSQEPTGLPWLVVAYPPGRTARGSVWSGRLSSPTARAVIDSPARDEIARRIAEGQSAVWVLIESGDRDKDEAAAAMLTRELARMPDALQLPAAAPGAATDPDVEAARAHLRVDFSLLRVSRTDPAEQVLVAMLLGSEADLRGEYASEPVAFPVFGRGRALMAVVGKGINADTTQFGCQSLIEACSCDIKDEFPGIDLLMNVPWEQTVQVSLVAEPELPSAIAALDTGQADGRDEEQPSSSEAAPAGGALARNILIAVGFIVLMVVVLVLRMNRLRDRS